MGIVYLYGISRDLIPKYLYIDSSSLYCFPRICEGDPKSIRLFSDIIIFYSMESRKVTSHKYNNIIY